MFYLLFYEARSNKRETTLCILTDVMVAQTVKESTCNAGDPGLTPGSVRYSGEGNGYPLQYSCLENSIDRRA